MPMAHQISPKCGAPLRVLSCPSIITNRNIGSLHWRHGERMTEYLDELICLFRKLDKVPRSASRTER